MKPCGSSWVAQIAICTSLSFTERSMEADFSGIFGADLKILASLEMTPGETRVEWRRLILSVQHIPRLPYEQQHRIFLPILEQILRDLEAEGLEGAASTFSAEKLVLNGAGEFAIGGPHGDNGLSGKKLVIDHYGPGAHRGRRAGRQGPAQGGQARSAASPPVGEEACSRGSRGSPRDAVGKGRGQSLQTCSWRFRFLIFRLFAFRKTLTARLTLLG